MGYEDNISPEDKALLTSFRQDRYWAEWSNTLHPRTKGNYESCLFRVLKGIGLNPTQIIDKAKVDSDALSVQVKIFLKSNNGVSASYRIQMRSALKNFLNLNELDVRLLGLKIKVGKSSKPYLSWGDALKIIEHASPEYQPIYRFMLWSALDTERFRQLNTDAKRLADIKLQLDNTGSRWIKIDIPEGRKQSSPFYVMVPREAAELLPVLDQEGKPIDRKQNIHYNWSVARMRVGFNRPRFGQHNLRSAWKGEAIYRKLPTELIEFQLGHEVDALNYTRVNQNLPWVLEQFSKAWATQPVATRSEMEELRAEVDFLRKGSQQIRESLGLLSELELRSDEDTKRFLKIMVQEGFISRERVKPSSLMAERKKSTKREK